MMNDKLVRYMAICLGISMCVYRPSTALGNVFIILSILLFLYLLYKSKKDNVNLLANIAVNIG